MKLWMLKTLTYVSESESHFSSTSPGTNQIADTSDHYLKNDHDMEFLGRNFCLLRKRSLFRIAHYLESVMNVHDLKKTVLYFFYFKTCQEFPLKRVYLDLQWSEHIVSAPHFEAGFASFKMRGGNDMLRPL